METVTLRNGCELPRELVSAVMVSLRTLLDEAPIAFHGLVMNCRDHATPLFGDEPVILKNLGLINDVTPTGYPLIHYGVRNIVLSSIAGEGFDATIEGPFAVID